MTVQISEFRKFDSERITSYYLPLILESKFPGCKYDFKIIDQSSYVSNIQEIVVTVTDPNTGEVKFTGSILIPELIFDIFVKYRLSYYIMSLEFMRPIIWSNKTIRLWSWLGPPLRINISGSDYGIFLGNDDITPVRTSIICDNNQCSVAEGCSLRQNVDGILKVSKLNKIFFDPHTWSVYKNLYKDIFVEPCMFHFVNVILQNMNLFNLEPDDLRFRRIVCFEPLLSQLVSKRNWNRINILDFQRLIYVDPGIPMFVSNLAFRCKVPGSKGKLHPSHNFVACLITVGDDPSDYISLYDIVVDEYGIPQVLKGG